MYSFVLERQHRPRQDRNPSAKPEGLLHDRSDLALVADHGQVHTSRQEAGVKRLQINPNPIDFDLKHVIHQQIDNDSYIFRWFIHKVHNTQFESG